MDSIKTANQVWNEETNRFRGRRLGENDYRDLCRALAGAILRELRQTGDCSFLSETEKKLREGQAPYVILDSWLYCAYLAVCYAQMSLAKLDADAERCLEGSYTLPDNNDIKWSQLPRGVRFHCARSGYLKLIADLRSDAEAEARQRQREPAAQNQGKRSIPIVDGDEEARQRSSQRSQSNTPDNAAEAGRIPEEDRRDIPGADGTPAAGEKLAEASRKLAEADQRSTEADQMYADAAKLLGLVRGETYRRETLWERFHGLREENDGAASFLDSAKASAERIISEANAHREKVLSEARNEAAEITTEARNRANVILGDAKEDARQIRLGAESAARQEIAAKAGRYLREEIAAQTAPETSFPVEHAEEVDSLKAAATDGAYAIERSLKEQLDGFREQLNSTKHQIQDQLDDWRRSLYGQEYSGLADFYQNLYRKLGSGSKTVYAIAAQIEYIEAKAEPSAQEAELLDRLRKLQKELASLVEQLGKVMGGLGLEIVLPKPGDPFDPELHVDVEASDDSVPDGGVVESVLYPAVCGKDAAGCRMPIRRAEVRLRNEEAGRDLR